MTELSCHMSSHRAASGPKSGRRGRGSTAPVAAVAILLAGLTAASAAESTGEQARNLVAVADGVVQPRRPISEAIADAIRFLQKADGSYVPGRIDGELAGYFMAAHVNPDGTRSTRRQLSFPARHHAYFIRTFLHYYVYNGDREWLQRARDLADWNIAHSTPADAAYPHLPYSSFEGGKPTGSADRHSIETDKPAFLGSAYLAIYESTADSRYLQAAQRIAATLLPRQRADGSWPFRVVPGDGAVYQDLGGALVFFVEFFEHLHRHDANPAYLRTRDGAMRCLIERHVEQGQWGTYHEDIGPKTGAHLSAEPMSFTADYLFRAGRRNPSLIALGRRVLAQMEAILVHTTGHAAAPAPAVAEQANFAHIMPGHTARYCLALTSLYLATGETDPKERALQGMNAVTYMQSEAGLFRTFFYDTVKRADGATGRPDWYSQHLYTVCHLLETTAIFPERVPSGQDHVLRCSIGLQDVRYAPGAVHYAVLAPAEVTIKLSFQPRSVALAGEVLAHRENHPFPGEGWHFQPTTKVLTLRHGRGAVEVR
jgi:hypothetical protein